MRTSALALVGLMTFLLVRLLRDVGDKPLHEDEAVAGLLSARPLGEMLETVVLDRGGAPLHFLLAHAALAVDTSADALRWLSVVFALATIPAAYDLGRRLAGATAGLTAAALAAASEFLAVYGSFGRMYSLFALVCVVAVDLFVRAVDRPTRATALAAALAALLPLAVHPFGAFLFAAEAMVALWLWRGHDIRTALPALVAALAAVPLLLINLRLTERYGDEDLNARYDAREAGVRALGASAGGTGVVLAAFVALAVAGAYVLARRRNAFGWLALITIAVPPAVLALAGAANLIGDRVGPRHLAFMLPMWIGLVSAGAALRPLLAVGAVVLAFVAPAAIEDPRDVMTDRDVDTPAASLRISPGDVLYPASPVFLAALPEAADGRAFPREPVALRRTARRTHDVPGVFVSLPTETSWRILYRRGPFRDGRAVLVAIADLLEGREGAYALQLRGAACAALSERC